MRSMCRIWKSSVTSKIQLFGWRLIINKLPTRVEQSKRGVINGSHDMVCVFCFREEETSSYLFSSWSYSMQGWILVFEWIFLTGSPLLQIIGDAERLIYNHLLNSPTSNYSSKNFIKFKQCLNFYLSTDLMNTFIEFSSDATLSTTIFLNSSDET